LAVEKVNFRGEQLNIFLSRNPDFFSSFTLAVVSCPAAQAIAPRFKEAVTVTAAVAAASSFASRSSC
jgi:hypothetical protein